MAAGTAGSAVRFLGKFATRGAAFELKRVGGQDIRTASDINGPEPTFPAVAPPGWGGTAECCAVFL